MELIYLSIHIVSVKYHSKFLMDVDGAMKSFSTLIDGKWRSGWCIEQPVHQYLFHLPLFNV